MMKNTVFNYDKKEIIGLVNSVDTGMSTAVINDDSTLSQLQVNQLLAVQSPKSGRFIIAMKKKQKMELLLPHSTRFDLFS